VIKPSVLLISSKDDFSTDYIVSTLRRRGVEYWRVNLEDLDSIAMELDPVGGRVRAITEGGEVHIDEQSLHAVYYRGPSYTRHFTPEDIEPRELFRRQHGWIFLRSLSLLDGAIWIDTPQAVYRAEHKALQLQRAARLGMSVPLTSISNSWVLAKSRVDAPMVAIKPIDTLVFTDADSQGFTYTQMEPRDALPTLQLGGAPCILQQGLLEKVDIRVTVVGGRVFAASITQDGEGVQGDWRPLKQSVQVCECQLPPELSRNCVELVRSFGLNYGAIDLARVRDTFFFLELNPMGEWAWLEDTFGGAIPEALTEMLIA